MIHFLSRKYQKHISCLLFVIFYSSMVLPAYAGRNKDRNYTYITNYSTKSFSNKKPVKYSDQDLKVNHLERNYSTINLIEKNMNYGLVINHADNNSSNFNISEKKNITTNNTTLHQPASIKKLHIGGPTQPEMSSFKPAGVNNMVNLFTGDFTYNIPLMDVGGYPINIFYDANISMEQEASWVGLGWNINPGTVNRNMRGVPDDFNGEEQLVQIQKMKPNITWGVNVGADVELIGIKNFSIGLGTSLGVSVNNYLGPSLDLGLKGSTAFQISGKAAAEKNASPQLGAGIDLNLSSRSGLTLSPNVSLTASAFNNDTKTSFGVGASTSYNSRSGIKAIQISEQMSFNVNNNRYSNFSGGMSTPINFAKPSYIPSLRMPVTNTAYAGHFQLGGGIFGGYASVEAEVYQQKSEVAPADVTIRKPMIGYLHYQKAKNNANAVMDFSRFNDNEVTTNTPIISVPQYAYDVFSIQGEGTGGTIRAYRNDISYVRDNLTQSQDKSIAAGADVGPPGHYGANVNIIKTPTTIGEWGDGNKLRNSLHFKEADSIYENVYFRNPGETSVLHPNQYDKIGGTELVRFKLGASKISPTVESKLERFSNAGKLTGTTDITTAPNSNERVKRTQVINFFTAEEASKIGLDTTINNYDTKTILDNSNNLMYTKLPRFDNTIRKRNHISQINVTEANGSRYVYGLPVYNLKQKDFTFSVSNTGTNDDKVTFSAEQAKENSPLLASSSSRDGYVQITETPAYAHSFLLTGLLSNDYVDVNGDGITEDDLGNAVKFNYTKIPQKHQWRTPLTAGNTPIANFNAGKRSDVKDDKGLVSYGERESWYVHSIESKTMIALFTLENREDGKGALDSLKGIHTADTSIKRLKKIDLYNKADLKKNGLAKAKPIKTVNFEYSYNLCKATPDNTTGKGKLTLNGIYFTYNGQNKSNKNKYVFSYAYDKNADVTQNADNPAYAFNASDKWNNYKPSSLNPASLKNADYPYSIQDTTKKNIIDQNAGAGALKKILLPSGGQIEVQYESDDYAFVQNKRAANMMQIVGFGNDPAIASITNRLYNVTGSGITENGYVFIRVPEACASVEEAFQKYLLDQNQLAFKLMVNMPKGPEYFTSYATIHSYGLYAPDNNKKTIWVKLNEVEGISPLSLTAMEFLRQQLPGQAFTGYDVSESTGLKQAGEMMMGMLDNLKNAFKNPLEFLRSQGKAQTVDVTKSFVRLNDPDGYKYGGGHRVKSVKLKDNWNAMTGQYTSEYGQEYNYETTEVFNGVQRTISSGVASYEPTIGGEENPFHSIVQVENKLPLGPASYGAIEMPVLDAFFPAPLVGYSKVTVKSIRKGYIDPATQKTRSGIGKQVTEFYTAKDFPVYYSHTSFDDVSDKQFHQNEMNAFFYKYAMDSRALSQGFIVATNDMHGKLKSQASYPENDDKTPISFTQNFYRNTGEKGLDEKFDFVNAAQGGTIIQGNMGIDVELMTDTREFAVNTKALEIQGQADLFPVLFPIWLPFVWPVTAKAENTYRAVTTTKVINYHSIVDSVVVIDKGSMVSTKNLLYDAETGNVVVSRTNNEFDQPVYNASYPAYWAYSGMGLAYKNIDAIYKNVNFKDGKIISNHVPVKNIESGDELFVIKQEDIPQIPKISATVSYSCSAQNSQGDVTLKFTFPQPTPVPIKLFVAYVYQNNQGYGWGGITLPPGTELKGSNVPLYIDIPAGVTFYSTPFPDLNASGQFWPCFDGLPNLPGLYKKDMYLKVNTPNSYLADFVLTTPGLTLHNDISNGPPADCIAGSTDANKIWAFNKNKNTSSLTDPNPDFVFMDASGKLYTKNNVNFRIVRSGKRNILNAEAGNVVTMSNPVVTVNNVKKLIIDNSSKVINATAVEYKEKWQVDNEVFRRIKYNNCSETLDCGGQLEKSINPYRKGLLGNFKIHQNKILYASRDEIDPKVATNLPKNGYLNNFKHYWNFNAFNNLVPDIASTQWMWNNEITRVNAKGLELETKDALNIYTAAQYGFNKTLPVAIANNARYNEMANESFEGNVYNESLNNGISNPCTKTHIDFVNMPNSNLVNTDTTNFTAHTGKYVLGVNAFTSASKQFTVNKDSIYNYTLQFIKDTTKKLHEFGGEVNVINLSPNTNPPLLFTKNLYNGQNVNGFNVGFSGDHSVAAYSASYSYFTETTQYIEIVNNGNYDFKLVKIGSTTVMEGFESIGGSSGSYTVYDLDGNIMNPTLTICQPYSDAFNESCTKTYSMCKGIYKIVLKSAASRSCEVGNNGNDIPNEQLITLSGQDAWTFSCVNYPMPSYGSLSTLNGCIFTKPIAAKDSMINPTFTIPVNKPMLLSTWVKENCNNENVVCKNKISLNFTDVNNAFISSVDLQPSGPIIEGWQRYESSFTAPLTATNMRLNFVNNSSSKIYFDDIRIHPFNANMKTYVYDPINLRLVAELDANNYATYYEYDEEGTLIRTKAETQEGVKTITETRSAKQKNITTIQ